MDPAPVVCGVCGTSNEAGRKFCAECGSRLGVICAVCGTANPAIAKFCGECRSTLQPDAAATAADADRGVGSALELVADVPSIAEGGQTIQARAGVLTGEAAVTIGAVGQGLVAGDLVNTASRLQSAAAPGTVLVGEATFHAAST